MFQSCWSLMKSGLGLEDRQQFRTLVVSIAKLFLILTGGSNHNNHASGQYFIKIL